jgi:hypothetical protein
MLDPQPVADTWGAFRNGKVDASATRGDWMHEVYDADGQLVSGATQQLAVVPGTENQSWFRIYRETQADHDCVDNVGAPGTEWWDRVKVASDLPPAVPGTIKQKNWSLFIVACGAGGTRGYRFWNDADIGKWEVDHGLPGGTGRALEPVTAEESGLFPDEGTFRELLASTRVLWFRCEWSALQSGARTMNVYNDSMWRVGTRPWQHYLHGPQTPAYQYTAQYAKTEVKQTGDDDESDSRSNSPKTYGGNIKWLQRLDRDPILW